MKFKGKELAEHSLEELNSIDWELSTQEQKFNAALEHPKFQTEEKGKKIRPLPTINPSFIALREEVKKQIEVKKNGK